MPSRALLRGFLALWIVAGVVLFISSVATVREAWFDTPHGNPHVALLGTVEAIAAVLFLIPRAMRMGSTILLATLGLAFVLHAGLGEFRGDLLVCAVAVLFVGLHGPLTAAQWRIATARSVT